MTIKVAINGYGTIGKRVADAVAAQPDMEIVGVSKTSMNAEAYIAKERGYPLYIADMTKRPDFENAGVPIAGTVVEMIKKADVVVDATPGGVGLKNKPMYEEHKVRAIYQGGEKHTTTGFSFNSSVNYAEAKGRQFTRVVSCNTTGLVRIIHEMDRDVRRRDGQGRDGPACLGPRRHQARPGRRDRARPGDAPEPPRPGRPVRAPPHQDHDGRDDRADHVHAHARAPDDPEEARDPRARARADRRPIRAWAWSGSRPGSRRRPSSGSTCPT